MKNLELLNHPVLQHKITLLRDANTGCEKFRSLVDEISTLLCIHSSADLNLSDVTINTPFEAVNGKAIKSNGTAIIPILRSGLAICDAFIRFLPDAKVGHIGLYREPSSLSPIEYFCKMPDGIESMDAYILDPMLATGKTASSAIQFIKNYGVKNIKFVCMITSNQALDFLYNNHPEVKIYAAAVDERLNGNGFILPGLGDFCGRYYGTR